MVYAIKHDRRYKAHLVAGCHLTDTPITSTPYSSMVSLRGLQTALFLAELNGMKCWATDIRYAYLEADTSKKVYIIAGLEFREREDHILVI